MRIAGINTMFNEICFQVREARKSDRMKKSYWIDYFPPVTICVYASAHAVVVR